MIICRMQVSLILQRLQFTTTTTTANNRYTTSPIKLWDHKIINKGLLHQSVVDLYISIIKSK